MTGLDLLRFLQKMDTKALESFDMVVQVGEEFYPIDSAYIMREKSPHSDVIEAGSPVLVSVTRW